MSAISFNETRLQRRFSNVFPWQIKVLNSSETPLMYEWIKALHIIAVIAWMAGMLYLPRLLVYHCEAEIGSKQSETFKIMERRLLKAIIKPAMIITWLAGLYLAWSGHFFSAGWLHGKLALVIGLSAV